MREEELRENAICFICKKRIGHSGLPVFWTMVIERHALKLGAIQRQDGLGMMLGHSGLARIMGTNEEMTVSMLGPVRITVCETCASFKDIRLMDVAMRAEEQSDE